MKKIILAAIIAATGLTSCNNGQPKANLKSDIDTLSYEMGMAMSQSEGEFQNYLSQSGSDSAYVDELLKGYVDGMKAADDKRNSPTTWASCRACKPKCNSRKSSHKCSRATPQSASASKTL